MTETKDTSLAAQIREANSGGVVMLIPAERIRPNPLNFYEMSDLEELATSIETVGQLEPIKVKPDPEDERDYMIVDGERRFRAMTEVLDRDAVRALIVTPVDEITEELMLIEANRTQRKLSAADLSKQAERYTELLSRLKDSGVQIPGRLRDRVAEALQVGSAKLGRLHAIRENLIPRALELFDAGTINEATAYALQQLRTTAQELIVEASVTGKNLTEYEVRDLNRYMEKFMQEDCGGASCEHIPERVGLLTGQKSWERTCTGCCRSCYKVTHCRHACPKLSAFIAETKQKEKEARAAIKKSEQEVRDAEIAEADKDWKRFSALRERCGVSLEEISERCGYHAIIENYENRTTDRPTITVKGYLNGWNAIDKLTTLADAMGCTMDEIVGHEPKGVSISNTPPAGLEWHDTLQDGPPAHSTRNVICWTSKGELYKPIDVMLTEEFELGAETSCRWWAAVEGPEV